MLKIELITNSESETKHLAKSLAPHLQPGDIISLTGDLGAGKTRFVQGLAEGLGIKEAVTSPTFIIIREYQGRLPLYHFDVYRLTSSSELAPLGHEEYFYGEGVTVIEWGDKIIEALPDDRLTIEMHRAVESPDRRRLMITAGGPRSQKLLKGLAKEE
ncbi:MAG: tRNA (adenosine(37)-N6)-threonylcarbamoyltransferase complex ATPase subunit type 1 TsaE [Actinomycetota bacterium]|nr:tRNA (adenosine(37)-N6)-threonylcarbamoyltransferase complex ATPase subunit type 1 TsaE [Actinomycetota bacterium]